MLKYLFLKNFINLMLVDSCRPLYVPKTNRTIIQYNIAISRKINIFYMYNNLNNSETIKPLAIRIDQAQSTISSHIHIIFLLFFMLLFLFFSLSLIVITENYFFKNKTSKVYPI